MQLIRILAAFSGITLRMVNAKLDAREQGGKYVLANDRLYTEIDKTNGVMTSVQLDGMDMLGRPSGSTGQGPYLDCYCTPSGFWTPGTHRPEYAFWSDNATWAGVRMRDTHQDTGQIMEQYWFIRDGETGLHTFSRVAYYNETHPFLRNLQELRTLFRPSTDIYTHLVTNERQFAPLPGVEAVKNQVVVQDATWWLGNTTNDAYVQKESDYFTKYTFMDVWKDHKAHGMFADGTKTPDNTTYGAFLVHNTVDTYFGGPLHSDLVVDGIVYNYMVSNHHGEQTPNITNGFDRTFGPSFFYFNHGPAGASIHDLRQDAEQYADPTWNAEFYDVIAPFVTNYVPTSSRSTFRLHVDLPQGAQNPVAILTENHHYHQDNVYDTKALQYWTRISPNGDAAIPRVAHGSYRLTIIADGIFGDYVKDDVVVSVSPTAPRTHARWREESAGTEIFRIGTPDKSSGEFKHGYEPDQTKPLQPEQYRIYWGAYDFVEDFPNGVTFKVGESKEVDDMNYIHWSVFGGRGNHRRPEPYFGNGDVNNWTIKFDVNEENIQKKREATFTVQLAGAKTAAGNTDVFNASEPHANLAYTVNVNGADLAPWIIPYYHSSSCGVRSAVICFNLAHKFTFDPTLLKPGENKIVLSLPYAAQNYESALLTNSVYVQYDALRLEIR
ncbi:hypothetical protein MCOR27_005215 [Pyricularia oryzae]|uniref:rhamnogalacturonan endolyase n=2 Tax=Pyricularia TaxID=48558 RepID=A0ABQ8NW70_PYRGI|nr:hypothetical protein MCOR01_000771 [Pyricularia oryzae]KAI6303015.1 hypothetical protein MCOR33_001791 [Pyricularia grisea]KAH9428468.1 hypothetical protein MCOR02_011018 [Pyricularia oryzae]KAI6259946.1 hypothetical protein MCOR19_003770 [Pyricularia oryzae]KAI6276028.1 hypothetical protein MCOR26_005773 [Pyricularia oryzae]